MKVNLGNGTVKLNYKALPINWTGQYAQHVTENYMNQKPGHVLLHVEIQQALSKSKTIYKDGNNSYSAYTEIAEGTVLITFIKSTNFVAITTGYIMHSTMEKVTKNKKNKISGIRKVLPIPKENIEIMLSDGLTGNTEEEVKERLIRLFTHIYKDRGFKNFDLEFV